MARFTPGRLILLLAAAFLLPGAPALLANTAGKRVVPRMECLDLPAGRKSPDLLLAEEDARLYPAIRHSVLEGVVVDEAEMALLRRNRSTALADFGVILKQPQVDLNRALPAAVMLDKLGSPLGRQFVFKMLSEGSSAIRRRTLGTLDFRNSHDKQISKEEIVLYRSLLDDPDKDVRRGSAELLLGIPGLEADILKILQDPGIPRRAGLALDFAQKRPSPPTSLKLVALIREDLKTCPDIDIYLWTGALASCSTFPDKAAAAAAMKAIDEVFPGLPTAHRYDPHILRPLKDHFTTASLPALQGALAEAASPTSRCYALESIARLQGAQALPLILQYLDVPGLRVGCIAALGFAIRDENRAAILAQLAERYVRKPPSRAELIFLLRHGGEKGRAMVMDGLSAVPPRHHMMLMWRLHGWKLEDLAAKLKNTGLIAHTPSPEEMAEFRKQWCGDYHVKPGMEEESDMVPQFLEKLGLLCNARCYDVEPPVRHDLLLPEMAALSKGLLAPQAIKQTWTEKDRNAPYQIEFIQDGKLYRFRADNLGDSFDLRIVEDVLNSALKNKGAAQRYLKVNFEEGWDFYVFGEPATWENISQYFFLPLATGTDWTAEDGKTFELQAKKSLAESNGERPSSQRE